MKLGNNFPVFMAIMTLVKIKQELGLEAMVEYVDHYVEVINENNPKLGDAYQQAMKFINVEKIYQEMISKHK